MDHMIEPHSIVDDVQASRRLRNRTLQSIQYLASHVPTSVLKRLHNETLVQLENEGDQWHKFGASQQHVLLVDNMTLRENINTRSLVEKDHRRGSFERLSRDNSSVISDVSDLSSKDDDSDNEGSPNDSRFPLHFDIHNDHEDTERLIRSTVERCSRLESFDKDRIVKLVSDVAEVEEHSRVIGHERRVRPKRRATRRGSLASQISIISHRYFNDAPSLPYASKHESALLFVDISGFTRLSTLLDPESLSRAINSYFQLIVNEVTQHHGDIIKFAGDALFAEWKVSSNRSIITKSIESNVHMTLEDCVTAAAICGTKIVTKYCNHAIATNTTGAGVSNNKVGGRALTLSVHCGISVGELVSVHFGDDDIRRENVVLGDSINAVSDAAAHAALGEVAACPKTIKVMSRTCTLDTSIDPFDISEAKVIANQSSVLFSASEEYTARYSKKTKYDPLETRVARLLNGWDNAKLSRYRKLLSLYAHPVVEVNDATAFENPRASIHTRGDRQVEEAELRNVFVMFISPQISVSATGNDAVDSSLFNLLNSIMNLVTAELKRFGGHLRQYLVDDKGLVLIATFGLRGSTFPSMVSEWALPSTTSIHTKLQSELGVENRIGATIGDAYCGVVGGLMRHEYAVLGPSVNLAARLMVSGDNPGILVDDTIRLMADKSYGFRALNSIKAKGYADPVPIFEPLTPLQRRWGRMKPNFVGREKQLIELKAVACSMVQSPSPSKLVLLSGVSGVGKSTLVVHSIEQIKEAMRLMKKRIFITKHVSRECDVLTPFGSFGSILLDAMLREEVLVEENHMNSSATLLTTAPGNADGPIVRSNGGISVLNKSKVADRLATLCCELSAPADFAELIGQHLLKLDLRPYLDASKISTNQHRSTDISLVNFIARVFHRCTQDVDLVIVALDDVHLADDMSWRVIEELFSIAPNIMMVCTTRQLSDYQLAVDGDFWNRLQAQHIPSGRFVPIELKGLDVSETRAMIAKTLGIDEDEISERMHLGVFTQSSGIPQFAHVLLENMQKSPPCRATSDFLRESPKLTQSSSSQTSFQQLILQRLDCITGAARNVLNLAAVMGASFEFSHIAEVMKEHCYQEETLEFSTTLARHALTLAVQEGVLYAEYNGCEMPGHSMNEEVAIIEDLTYLFSHDIWRSTILELMLDTRKRTMHRNIALTLENACEDNTMDFMSRLRVFAHWKGSGDFVKASTLALHVGRMFDDIGLNKQRIRLYNDSLDMWKASDSCDDCSEKSVAGFSRAVLDEVTEDEVVAFILLYIALGKACVNLHQAEEAAEAYQNALMLVKEAKAGGDLRDRSVVFPVFSGLYLLLKLGKVKTDMNCVYEQALVARFVAEARLHGDPIHYLRALAMQCETFSRIGNYTGALSVCSKLCDTYVPEAHTVESSLIYGSDRAAQSISLSALWLVEVGKTDEALKNCEYVVQDLMPKMQPRNVHNSFITLYPTMLLMKEHGMALQARDILKRYILDVFRDFFGEGAFTFALPMFKPMDMLLDLHGNQNAEIEGLESYVTWALEPTNLRIGVTLNNALSWGRVANSVTAEICLLLAKRVGDCHIKSKLINEGLTLMTEAVALAKQKGAAPSLRFSIPVLEELKELAKYL